MTNSILDELDKPHVFGLALCRGGKGKDLKDWNASVCDKEGHWTPMCCAKTATGALKLALAHIAPKDFETKRPTVKDAAQDDLDFG